MRKPFLIWFLLLNCQLLILAIGIYFDFHYALLENDKTFLSFVIILLWAVTSGLIGYWHKIEDKVHIKNLANIGWYLAETCMALGMIGTVTGFLLMLGTAFSGIDVSNTTNLQQALSSMASGMSTALYTTLVGLIASVFIKSQLVNLEHYADGLQ